MKRIVAVMAIMAASISYSTMALSEEHQLGLPNKYDNTIKQGQKDECLILVKNCIDNNETVIKRVERLQKEIEKGTDVYTPDELNILKNQLNLINSDRADYSGDTY